MKTRGSFKGAKLKLSNIQPGASVRISGIKEPPISHEKASAYDFSVGLNNLLAGAVRMDVASGRYDDHILARQVQEPTQMDRSLEFQHKEPAQAGDYFYIRVLQTDGGLAWSSPFRVQ